MYKSPIEMIASEMTLNFENELEDKCVKAVQSYGFNINKEELLKALQYDRGQYDQGYKDGYEAGKGDGISVGWLWEWVYKHIFKEVRSTVFQQPTELQLQVFETINSMIGEWRKENGS